MMLRFVGSLISTHTHDDDDDDDDEFEVFVPQG